MPGPIMHVHERAAQIWPLLCWAATSRQILTYDIVGRLIGVPRQGLANLLEPIQSHCLIRELPPLTVIVVNAEGVPGDGFIAAENIPLAQAMVFSHNWLEEPSPTPDQFAMAVRERPSCGRPEAVRVVSYYVYENWVAENKAVIHRADCGHCNHGKGAHENTRGGQNGQWHGSFSTVEGAAKFAEETRRTVRKCAHCMGSTNPPATSEST